MYCLLWDVLCIVCVYMCTELLLPGGYTISVKYIIYSTMNDIHDTIFSRRKLYVSTLTHKTNKSALTCTAHIPALRGYC
jgi:hypothetical protein